MGPHDRLEGLVVRAQAGDSQAWSDVLAICAGGLYRMALRMTSDACEAEDLVQEASIRAWQSISQCRCPRAFRAWLSRLLCNLVHDCRRHKQLETVPFDGTNLVGHPSIQIEGVDRKVVAKISLATAKRQVLESLGPHERSVAKYMFAEYERIETLPTVQAISHRLNLSHTTAQRRRMAVLKALERALRELGLFEEYASLR